MQTLKKAILVGRDDPRSSQHKLASFLLSYRTTPHSVTGVPPSELLYGCRPKTVLDILKPDMSDTVRKKQESQKRVHDSHSKDRLIEVGDSVVVRVHHGNVVNWEPGSVVEKHSPVSMVLKLDNGLKRKYHIDQVQLRKQIPEPIIRSYPLILSRLSRKPPLK